MMFRTRDTRAGGAGLSSPVLIHPNHAVSKLLFLGAGSVAFSRTSVTSRSTRLIRRMPGPRSSTPSGNRDMRGCLR